MKKPRVCPQGSQLQVQLADKITSLAIWVNGATSEYGAYESVVDSLVEKYERKISEIENELSRYHQKDRSGRLYWYRVENRDWTYIGKDDPRPALQKKIVIFQKSIKDTRAAMSGCIIKECNSHLVVDVQKLKSCVRKLPDDLIVLGDIL